MQYHVNYTTSKKHSVCNIFFCIYNITDVLLLALSPFTYIVAKNPKALVRNHSSFLSLLAWRRLSIKALNE